jgi:uncharacterized protein YhfF
MSIPAAVRPFWDAFTAAVGQDRSAHFDEAFYFCDDEASANELAALVLAGTKRATAALVWAFEAVDKPMPKPGNLSIVTDWAGTPLCVIETKATAIVPFEDVSAEFAATEGEGDGSLAYWREAHWAYFGRECTRLGKPPSLRMPVLCERFEVVWRPA